jgi:Carbohydrate esterase, sialic acid-specific acetylesterase
MKPLYHSFLRASGLGQTLSVAGLVVGALAMMLASPAMMATTISQPADKAPIKVFILAGQSNMEGYGGIQTLDELGTHPTASGLLRKVKKADGSFVTRDDVFLYYHRDDQTIRGPLTVGQGAGPDRIGPELMFGVVMGDYFEEPVLLIKTAWGGKDLYCDFRPPSAGKPPYEIPGARRQVGLAYRQMVAEIHECLDHLETNFPQFTGRSFQLCGFVWFQGWNDFCADPKIRAQVYQEYPRNFLHLVQDLRTELKVPNLPVVVGELGVDGEKHVSKEMVAFRAAQAKIVSQPELNGTVRYVPTAIFWYDKLDELPRRLDAEERRVREKVKANLREELRVQPEAQDSKRMEERVNAALESARKEDEGYLTVQKEHDRAVSHWECHYWGSARVYCLVGNGLGEAMKELLRKN